MTDVKLSNPRKRRIPESLSPHPSGSSQHAFKKPKHSQQDQSKLSPTFWDNLSKTYLTKRALQEVNRRNTQPVRSSRSRHSRPRQPLTRSALAELKASSQPLIPAIDYLCGCESRVLRNIKQTARHGGPDLSEIRSFPEHLNLLDQTISSRSNSRAPKRSSSSTPNIISSSRTTNTKSTGSYDRNFQQKLIDGGVYPHGYRYPNGQIPAKPDNWEDIQRVLTQHRPSLSPSRFSEKDYEKFVQADADAAKEKQVITSVIPIIAGAIEDGKCVSGDVPFTNLEPLTDGTLVPPKPDIYHGARPEQLHRTVRDACSSQAIPSTQDHLPIVPNFTVEAKGPDGSLAVAGRQASYHGAVGARAMKSVQSYGEDPFYDNKAHTITCIYHGGTLKMYTSHVAPSSGSGSTPEYFMTQLNTWGMTGNIETFRQGAAAYRNSQEWTKDKRDEAMSQANERAAELQAKALAIGTSFERIPTSASETTVGNGSILSQESRNQLDETSSATADPRDCCTPPPDPELGPQPTKRSSELIKQRSPLQRKRRNVVQSSEASGLSQHLQDQILESDSQPSEPEASKGGVNNDGQNRFG